MPEPKGKQVTGDPEEKEPAKPEKPNPPVKELNRNELESLRRNLKSKFHR
jgi:hypothetical protein